MPTMFVGDYIKRRRKELELTQEQLCEGICDATTVSRLETGFQAPRRTILNALLQRLGLPETRYFAVVTKSELDLETLKKRSLPVMYKNIGRRAGRSLRSCGR